MSRSPSVRPLSGSVSALALVAVLGACSQPASYATVDLSGSNSGNYQTAYSPVTGQPVYSATSQYGPQSFPDAGQYQPNSQFAALDAPRNQVASLGNGNGGFDTYGILNQQQQQPAPQYSPVASSPSYGQQNLLQSQQFRREAESVNQAFEDSQRVARQPFAPFEEAESLADVAPFEPERGGDLEVAPVETGSAVRNSGSSQQGFGQRRSQIEETSLEPIAPKVNRDAETVGEDYATLPGARAGSDATRQQPPARAQRGYQPWLAPQFGTQEPTRRAPAQREAPARSVEAEEKSGPENEFTRAARDLLPERSIEARLPSPSTVPPVQRSFSGGGMTVPKASAEYARPYELLRPGVWPELENPGVGLVQAPTPTPLPQFAAFAPPIVEPSGEAIESASQRGSRVYEIKSGDNLLTIANSLGTTPDALAAANGLDLEANIFIGQILALPVGVAAAAPVPFATLIESTTIGAASDPSDIGGPAVPMIDMAMADKAWGQQRIQSASTPKYRATTMGAPAAKVAMATQAKQFSWPVHGNVYQLDSGQVEIDAGINKPVTASAAGKVVHVERGPMGVLVVIEHANGWRSLTVGLDYSAVRPGEAVAQGAMIGKSGREHRVRFELRDAGAGNADTLKQLRG